jgi:hypothetical protein
MPSHSRIGIADGGEPNGALTLVKKNQEQNRSRGSFREVRRSQNSLGGRWTWQFRSTNAALQSRARRLCEPYAHPGRECSSRPGLLQTNFRRRLVPAPNVIQGVIPDTLQHVGSA